MNKFDLPAVGTQFLLTQSRPWGKGQMEVTTIACLVTKRTTGLIEYSVTEIVNVENKCPNYAEHLGGGISALGWERAVKSDRVHVIE